ncbi:hypothetical protein Belba_0759 [Belliella baltica DSM 15883]|uniref:Uncharacterized protein n=1 Tax=Belliella baltica (strain DSM 15883 / CIP 108006 / LMG 21964 / BA134) TaxID=866536 RepID=I3Z2E3_BELBD|nr:hypothetical protein Belba_0759 [Belliella baltica DSM 15883]
MFYNIDLQIVMTSSLTDVDNLMKMWIKKPCFLLSTNAAHFKGF